MRKLFLSLVIGALLTGCTALGLAPAQTTDQRIAYAYAVEIGILNTIAQAVDSGTISSAQAAQANTLAIQSKAVLDAAREAKSQGNEPEAIKDLNMATSVLTTIQNFLNGAKK